jgi:hypothetical protein
MGFSDTATYLRTRSPAAVQKALTPILARYGYQRSRRDHYVFVPSYTPLAETPNLQFWLQQASDQFLRIYSSHSGIFAIHDGDYVPVLQRVAASLRTDAFEIAVNDGDSISVLETDGARSRLTGCHSYVLDDIYERKGDLTLTPGEIYPFRGIPFPYQAMEVDAQIVPELIGHDFGDDMQAAIEDFEVAVFGQKMASYYDFDGKSPEATKEDVFNYVLQG